MIQYTDIIEAVSNALRSLYPDFDIIIDDLEEDFNKVIKIVIFTNKKQLMDRRYITHIMILLDIYHSDMSEIMDMGANIHSVLKMLPMQDFILKGYDYAFKAEGIQSSKKTFNSKQQKVILGNASIMYDLIEYDDKEQIPCMMKYKENQGVKNGE